MIEVRLDIAYKDGEALPIRSESDIADLEKRIEESKKKQKGKLPPGTMPPDTLEMLLSVAKAMRQENEGNIRTEVVTFPAPTGADRIEIRSEACDSTDDGRRMFNPERELLSSLEVMLTKSEATWTLQNGEGKPLPITVEAIRNAMPICLQDVVYAAIYRRLYPTQGRLDFLPL
jgi:hypothetical protein